MLNILRLKIWKWKWMFFLSSTDDNDVFEFNNGNLFCNTLKDYLRFYVDKDIFVKFESVVVKGVKAKSFLICLKGVPYDRTVRYNSLPDEVLSNGSIIRHPK